MTKRTRRRTAAAFAARLAATGTEGPPVAVGRIIRITRVTFSAVDLEVLTTPWLLDRCSSEQGWRWLAFPGVLDLGELASIPGA